VIDSFAPDFPLPEGIRSALEAPTRRAFRLSPFYRADGRKLEDWIVAIRSGSPPRGVPESVDPGVIRVVHWNIQQGKAWDALVDVIAREGLLRDADLISLNEVDIGTARVGNRNVVRELAERIGRHWIYVANFLELTKGLGPDRLVPGENALGLHGIAILSRWPIATPGSAELPDCFDYFHFPEEKRYGHRRVLWGRILHPREPFIFATTHLEVRNTPACRARQIARALAALPSGPAWFTGDWNTNTFRRRTIIDQAGEFIRMQRTDPAALDRQLAAPYDREPLLGLVESAGFALREWNDATPTVRQVLSGVEEMEKLPRVFRDAVTSRYDLKNRVLRMRLDWIAARGPWKPASAVWTLASAGPDGCGASDHTPIGCEAAWK
jgi:endonuclease/exonuclease/phosphatase family metal-dependent hydrolase